MPTPPGAGIGLRHLRPHIPDSDEVHIVIETPRGHRTKYAYDEASGLFSLSGLLPAGAVFPYDFGFLPATRAGDGDPLDVLVLMEEPAFPGCLVRCRLIGVIQAEQTERDGATMRNDRLLAVAAKSQLYASVQSLDDLEPALVDQIEHFFVSYNAIKGKTFAPLGRHGPDHAHQALAEALITPRPKRSGRAKRGT